MQEIRIGSIGCGGIGTGAHLPATRYLRDRVRLVAAADVNLEAARAAGAPRDATAYADYRAVLERRAMALRLALAAVETARTGRVVRLDEGEDA